MKNHASSRTSRHVSGCEVAFALPVLPALCLITLAGCSDGSATRFGGKTGLPPLRVASENAQPAVVMATPPPAVVVATPVTDITYGEPVPAATPVEGGESTEFAMSQPLQVAFSDRNIWVVTDTKVYRIKVDAERGYPIKTWAKPNNWGNRTYVSEIGLVIGQSNRNNLGGIYLVNDSSDSAIPIASGADLNMGGESRLCVTSYKVNGIAYIGGGYFATDGKRRFVSIPIDPSKTNSLDIAKRKIYPAGTDGGIWGYSCYVDQVNMRYWGTQGGDVYGFDLQNNVPLANTEIPNAAQVLATADFEIFPTKRGSYAISGDSNGNVLSVRSITPGVGNTNASYTFAHEPISDFVFGSSRIGKLYATHASCFANAANCPAGVKHFSYDISALSSLGPLSSLNNGSVAGIVRGSKSDVYLISLKDRKKPLLGLDFTKVASVAGNAYMYTDFTGATLYADVTEKEFSLSDSPDFRVGKSISDMKIEWKSEGDVADLPWKGLKMSIRCYAKSAVNKPDWQQVNAVAPSASLFAVVVPSCNGVFDMVEIRVEGDGTTNAFSRIEAISILATQS